MNNLHWPYIRAKLREAVLILPHFFKNPVQGMRTLPEWEWPTILILQAIWAAACAVVANLIDRDLLGIFTGLILAPIANVLLVAIGAGFFFYTFMFFFDREIPYRQLYVTLLFAAIPVQIVSVVAGLLPPIFLAGAAGMLMLLFVAFVDRFHLDRKKTRALLGGLMALYAVFWGVQLAKSSSKRQNLRQIATPESMDTLERELKGN